MRGVFMRGNQTVKLEHVTWVDVSPFGIRVWCETCGADEAMEEVNCVGAAALIEWIAGFLIGHELEKR